MDEPTNHLDIKYQLQIMDIVKSLNLTVIAAIHDLNIAAMYCDRLVALKDGQIVGAGKPKDLLTEKFIKDLYEVDTKIEALPNDNINIRFYQNILNKQFKYFKEVMYMKNIAILTCLKANDVCTGASCLDAFYNKRDFYSIYQ